MTDLEKAYAIAAKLSHMSVVEGAWDKMQAHLVYDIEVDGETISIGPFTLEYEGWSETMIWKIPNSNYGIMVSGDQFDSWGTHYDDYGVEFGVVELEAIVVYRVKERHWDNPNPMPKRGPRW